MKKTLIIVLSLVLVVVMTVAGTMAYLTDKTEEVKNTFTVGSIFVPDDPDDPDDDIALELKEHGIKDDNNDGKYEFDLTTETIGNKYKVLPGVALPKDPFIRTNRDTEMAAYLFLEVVDETSDALSFTVDPDNWTKLYDATETRGAIYYYKTTGIVPADTKAPLTVNILKDQAITVSNVEITNPGEVSFLGYMIQAGGFDTPAAAWAGLNPTT